MQSARLPDQLKQQAALLDLAHESVFARGIDDRITFWNRCAEERLGWTAAEAAGQVAHIMLRTRFPKPLSEIKADLEASGRWEGELAHTTRDGRVLFFESRWVLRQDEGGAESILELDSDITQLRAAEDALRQTKSEMEQLVTERLAELSGANEAFLESQDRFQQMAENIRDVFWLTNPARTIIIYVNPAYEQIWGRPCLCLYEDPRSWLDAVHLEDRARVRQVIENPVPEHGYEHAYRVVRPDGAIRWVLDREFPVRDNAGRFYRLVGIVRDITGQKELEKEILGISEREQRRIGQDLHDDLCQQLVGIELLSKALERQLKEPPQAAQAGEIAELIRAAIDHTRLLARGLAPFDLEADGLMKGLKILADRTSDLFRVDCSFDCPFPVLIPDIAVGTNLYRIAQEAVTNSIKHGKAKQIGITLRATVDAALLEVRDNGVGFAIKEQGARGMGLRIMKHRADTMGGSFSVQPGARTGTIVVCGVPLAAKTTPQKHEG